MSGSQGDAKGKTDSIYFNSFKARSHDPFLRIRFLLVQKIGSCERNENDLPTHGSVILKKADGNRTCSIFIQHSS